MKKCTQCGQNLSDETTYCFACGGSNFEPVADESVSQQQPPQQTYYQQPNQQQYYQQQGQQPYYQPQAGAPYQQDAPGRGNAVASLVLGIIALVVAWFGWGAIIAIVLSIIGIILGINGRKQLTPEQGRGMATAGMVCSIIALVLSAIVFVSCVICASALTGWGTAYPWIN